MLTDSLVLFRQMKASVRGSDKYLLVGIDVAKNKHHAFFGTPNGRTLRKNMVFDNSVKGFENLRGLAGDLKSQHGLTEYLLRQKEQIVYVSNVAVAKNRALSDGRWERFCR